jgi:hypothetical protein
LIEPVRVWARKNLTGTAMTGVLNALEHIPNHRVPRVQLDTQSPWAIVDAVPGPKLAVWIETGDVYEVDEDGAVGDEPIRKKVETDLDVLARALAVAARALEEAGQPLAARSARTILESVSIRRQ